MTDARASSTAARVQNGRFGCGSDGMPANWDLPPDRRVCARELRLAVLMARAR